MKIEQKLDENIGLQNKRVWPKTETKRTQSLRMYQ